jgi:hypothetical protein
MADVSSKLTGRQSLDDLPLAAALIDQLYFTGFNDEEPRVTVAPVEESFSAAKSLFCGGITPKLCDLLLR